MDCRSTVLNCSIGQIFKDKIFTVGQKKPRNQQKFLPSKSLVFDIIFLLLHKRLSISSPLVYRYHANV